MTVYSNIFIIYQKWLKFDLKGDCDHENALPTMGIKEFQKSIKVTKSSQLQDKYCLKDSEAKAQSFTSTLTETWEMWKQLMKQLSSAAKSS